MKDRTLALAFASSLAGVTAWSEPPKSQDAVLVAPSSIAGGGFARAVAMGGDLTVVGEPGTSFLVGSVYVFDGSTVTPLTPSGPMIRFGYSVATDGNRVVGGSVDHGLRVFEKAGGVWSESAAFVGPSGPSGNDLFAVSVGISGDTVAGGAPKAGFFAGEVYVFERIAGTWTKVQTLTPSDAQTNDDFGDRLALDGDTLVVGALYKGSNDRGGVYVFEKIGGAWTETAKFDGPFDNATLGRAVAVSGGTVAAVSSGGVHVYEKVAGAWTQTSLLSVGANAYATSVAVDDIYLVFDGKDVSAAFRRKNGGWKQIATLLSSDGVGEVEAFGSATAISGGIATCGAWLADAGPTDAGAAYVYDLHLLPYGPSCPGTAQPALVAIGDPSPGGAVRAVVEGGPASTAGLLFVGTQKLAAPIGFGCLLLVGPPPPFALPFVTSPAGMFSVIAALPAGTSGLGIKLQAILSDPPAPGGFAATAGFSITVR